MPTKRQMVLLGGGGFLMSPAADGSSAIDSFTLGLTGRARPRVCFVPTASGDRELNIESFLRAFPRRRAEASVLRLFRREWTDAQLREHLLSQDVIYVGGGNTANMLAIWRLHGVDRLLLRAWRGGTVLTGVSAGTNVWFEACSTDSFSGLAPLDDGLGVLGGAVCPHFDGEAMRRPSLHGWVAKGTLPETLAIDDFAAVHVVGTDVAAVVNERPGAAAYRVRRQGRRAVEEAMPAMELAGARRRRA